MNLGNLPYVCQSPQPILCHERIPVEMALIGGPSSGASWNGQHLSIIPEAHTSNSCHRSEEDSGMKHSSPSSPTLSPLWVDSAECQVIGQKC